MLYLAWYGHKNLFIGLLTISLSSDAVDGFIARKFNLTTKIGAKLDSLGDMANYLTIPICAWWLWPDILRQEAPYVLTAVSAYVVPLVAGVVKFHKIPSYHTLGAKIAAVLMCIAMFFLFIIRFPWLFRFAVIFQALEALEEVLITIRLSEMKSNIKSIWHLKNKTTR